MTALSTVDDAIGRSVELDHLDEPFERFNEPNDARARYVQFRHAFGARERSGASILRSVRAQTRVVVRANQRGASSSSGSEQHVETGTVLWSGMVLGKHLLGLRQRRRR
jgi:hypothetical protein